MAVMGLRDYVEFFCSLRIIYLTVLIYSKLHLKSFDHLYKNIKMKTYLHGRRTGRSFLKLFFLCEKTFFKVSFYEISLAYKSSYCLSANHNPELQCVICTGVTHFALVLHLNCTALSQSESNNFFMHIIIILIITQITQAADKKRTVNAVHVVAGMYMDDPR